MSIVTMDKNYRYRNGEEARVPLIDSGSKNFPVISVQTDGSPVTHTVDGHYYLSGITSSWDLIEISPYDHIKIDDNIIVWNGVNGTRHRRHFAHVGSVSGVYAFREGRTSWSAKDDYCHWDHCEKVED